MAILEPPLFPVRSPIDGSACFHMKGAMPNEIAAAGMRAQWAFSRWRDVPAPERGELIRVFGNVLRENRDRLADVITLESGKILAEAQGEVQEMIDICDFAVGLSRQLYGLTIASERPGHRMMEQWHPFGPVLVISAFNFPAAVWAWNFALAIVCGNSVVWKPSEKTFGVAVECERLYRMAAARYRHNTECHLLQVIYGDGAAAAAIIDQPEIRLVSATGSCAMGRAVSERVAKHLGKRALLELGGNNAMIVAPTADLDLAVRAILFGAVGTAGQRCTTLRRLFVHEDVYDALVPRLAKAYAGIKVGDPRDPKTLVGPLIDEVAGMRMSSAIDQAEAEGGMVLYGGKRVVLPGLTGGEYRHPVLMAIHKQTPIVREETFAPILYVMQYRDLDEAIALQNDVPQGLSSSIFTNDMREAEKFMSATGSDCGIANVNIGTSGAEIGGAFGGEKETGGGRESGSDSWKAYMRRTTNTVNYSRDLPLAQGIEFGEK